MTKSLDNEGFDPKKTRVLVVENNLRTALLHRQNLERWGYQAILAEGAGEALLTDAQAKAYEYACHIAVVDMRLVDDYDENDKSGLDLAPKLKPALSIIVSGSGNDRKTALEAIRKDAFDFIGKEEPLSRLQGSLECASQHMLCGKNGPVVVISTDLLQHIMGSLAPEKPEQIRELLKSLFSNAKKISVEEVDRSTRTPSLSRRRRSIVVRVTTDDHQPVVVKLSPRSRRNTGKVTQEEKNFRKFVEDKMPNRFYARIRTSQPKWHISGIVYDFLGASQENFVLFSKYYHNQPIENIQRALKHLFNNTWGERYRKTQTSPSTPQSLFNLYAKVWGKSKWLRQVQSYLDEKPKQIEFKFSPTKLSDPAHWVIHKTGGGESLAEDKSYLPHVQVAVTHGDMLGDNFFVDEDGHSWSIDYERTGRGPILQDFVQLELDILVRIAGFHEDELDDFVSMFLRLLKTNNAEIEHDLLDISQNVGIQKVYVAIRTIRQLASEFVTDGDWRIYYWGLLLNAVFRSILLKEKIRQNIGSDTGKLRFEQQLSLLVGAVLCRRLDDWGGNWPPPEWVLEQAQINTHTNDTTSADLSLPTTILFLTASPIDTPALQIEDEFRTIQQILSSATVGPNIRLEYYGAVRLDDLRGVLQRYRPRVLHFSGHGNSQGEILVKDEYGNSIPVPADALGEMLANWRDSLRCVILNACYTLHQAKVIAQHVNSVVVIDSKIEDGAAIKFAKGFYEALLDNNHLRACFEAGINEMKLHRLPGTELPRLECVVDPDRVYLLT